MKFYKFAAIVLLILFLTGAALAKNFDFFKKGDDTLWQDNHDWYWLDPTNRETWDYNVEIAKKAIDAGFDELNFDYISPMIYQSHYLPGNFGFAHPAEHPYKVILGTIEKGKEQIREKVILDIGTSTPALVNPIFDKELKKLRPWLQDFNIGAIYESEMIRKEKQAVYDAGLTSGWLLWDPRNIYTESALDK